MCGDKMKKKIQKYIIYNIKNITFFSVMFVIGIILGIIFFTTLNADNKAEILSSILNSVSLIQQEGFEKISILKNSLLINFYLVMLMFISTFTFFPFFINSGVILFKGISLSNYICLLFNIFGIGKGIFFMFFVAIIPNILQILLYIFIANESCLINEEIKKEKNLKRAFNVFFRLIFITICTIPFFILSVWLEQTFFMI